MKKIIIIFLIVVLIVSVIVGACICINKAKEAEVDNAKEEEKRQSVVVAKVVIENEAKTVDNTTEFTMNDQMYNTYQELINSPSIKNKVKEKYPKIGDIELEMVKDSDIIRVIFVCEEYSEEECIEIENMFLKEFSKRISELYNKKIYIIDEPAVEWRYM